MPRTQRWPVDDQPALACTGSTNMMSVSTQPHEPAATVQVTILVLGS
jgi:hypothetical protein